MSINLKGLKTKEDNKLQNNSVKGKNKNLFNLEISFSKNKIGNKRKEDFYSELGILLSSGIDIKTTLEIILNEQKSTSVKQIFTQVYENVLNGDSLSEALRKENDFTPYEINTIHIGEESSRMINVLDNLSCYFSKKIKQKRQLINAFSYPAITLITAFAAIYFMLNFMVPMFEDVFQRFEGNLPALTLKIIALSEFFSDYFLFFVLFLVCCGIYIYSVKEKIWFRSLSSKLLLITPFVGNIAKLIYTERFFQAMSLLTGAKIPLLRSIKLVKEMVDFYPFELALETTGKDIMYGKSLHESLNQFNLIDKKTISLIKVGEETNQLEFIFNKLNEKYSGQLEFQISIISSLLEPFIIIFIGLLVGVILIAMYLPMFQISTSVM